MSFGAKKAKQRQAVVVIHLEAEAPLFSAESLREFQRRMDEFGLAHRVPVRFELVQVRGSDVKA